MKRTETLAAFLSRHQRIVDRALERFLRGAASRPPEIHRAMRYSVFAGGKRLRPILCLMAAEACGKNPERVLPTACALELIHTYSLIHDDLPALDNDDFRRGRPTSHKAFGEAMAILAGDALLTQAFELIARNADVGGVRPAAVIQVTEEIARSAGTLGMIGGQVVDIEMTGANGSQPAARRRHVLNYIHRHKTGALIRTSLLAGARLADASRAQIRALERYGDAVGLAFQIADDILDIVGDKKLLGKRGSDRDNGKLTYPALYGLDASRRRAREEAEKAKRAVALFGARGEMFRRLADFIVERQK
jgi:geranylgeranyl diphosphate synthase, type II